MSKNKVNPTLLGLVLWGLLIAGIFSIPFLPQKIDKSLELDILNPKGNPLAIVFFGFQGCSSICPSTLSTLAHTLNNLEPGVQIPQVVFVDIQSASNTASAHQYAQQFHAQFKGLHVTPEQRDHLTTQFGLNIQEQGENIQHVGKTYFLQKSGDQWRLVKALPVSSVNKATFLANIESLSIQPTSKS